eukprot:11205035-Lingulodinium_polyedra.AAC.1
MVPAPERGRGRAGFVRLALRTARRVPGIPTHATSTRGHGCRSRGHGPTGRCRQPGNDGR